MNICFFNLTEESGSGAATVGGMERASHLLAKELRKRGHSVEFYYFKPPHRFTIPFISLFFPSVRSEKTRFRGFLKEHKIDIAIWHGGSAWSVPFSLKNLPCKLVTVCHNIPRFSEQICTDFIVEKFRLRSHLAGRFVRSKPYRFLIWKFYEFCRVRSFFYVLRYGDKFVLLSKEFFADFAPREKFPGKVCAIPNIAPFWGQGVSFDEKKKELLWLGRVNFPHKRPDFMLQIWQKLQDRFPDWSLRFVGDGPYLSELKKLSSSLGLKDVSFDGFQDPVPYYRSASIFCMTSAYEGFPMVLLEAANYCCVPIAFESFGAVRDTIEDGVNGVLVPPFDLDVYAEKLAQLMSNPELRARLATNAKKSVARFSPEAVGDKWEKLFREIQQG